VLWEYLKGKDENEGKNTGEGWTEVVGKLK
jgi:hypothetical protein